MCYYEYLVTLFLFVVLKVKYNIAMSEADMGHSGGKHIDASHMLDQKGACY